MVGPFKGPLPNIPPRAVTGIPRAPLVHPGGTALAAPTVTDPNLIPLNIPLMTPNIGVTTIWIKS